MRLFFCGLLAFFPPYFRLLGGDLPFTSGDIAKLCDIPTLSSIMCELRTCRRIYFVKFLIMENESVSYDKTAHLRAIRSAMKQNRVTQDDLANELHVDRSAVSRMLTGDRQIRFGELQKISAFLSLDAAELVASIPVSELSGLSDFKQEASADGSVAYLSGSVISRTKIRGAIPEIDVLVGAGEGAVGDVVPFHLKDETYSSHPITAEWVLPDNYVAHELQIAKSNALIMKIVGDSMSPTYSPGDRVILDTKQTSMTVDGVYVISDGESPPQVKRLQRVLFTSPPEVDVVSDNAAHRVQRVMLDQLVVIGRVAGRVSAA